MTKTQSQDGNFQIIDLFVVSRLIPLGGQGRASRNDNPFVPSEILRGVFGLPDLSQDMMAANFSSDKMGLLPTKIYDSDGVVFHGLHLTRSTEILGSLRNEVSKFPRNRDLVNSGKQIQSLRGRRKTMLNQQMAEGTSLTILQPSAARKSILPGRPFSLTSSSHGFDNPGGSLGPAAQTRCARSVNHLLR